MTLDERIKEALRRLKHGLGAMRIPADECDADLVLSECQTQLARLAAFATTVDAIRNDIIGTQSLNWSRHAYPLVAALHEVGFDGIGYAGAARDGGRVMSGFACGRCEACDGDLGGECVEPRGVEPGYWRERALTAEDWLRTARDALRACAARPMGSENDLKGALARIERNAYRATKALRATEHVAGSPDEREPADLFSDEVKP